MRKSRTRMWKPQITCRQSFCVHKLQGGDKGHVASGYCQQIDMWVLGIGDIEIKQRAHDPWLDGTLHEVLNIPYLRPIIFCIEKVANRGMVSIYKENTCRMIGDNIDGDIILTLTRTRNSLYKPHMKVVVTNKESQHE